MPYAGNGTKLCRAVGSTFRSLVAFAVAGTIAGTVAAPHDALAAGAGTRARTTTPARNPSPARAALIPAGETRVFEFDVVGYPTGRVYDGVGADRQIYVNRDARRVNVSVASTASGWSVIEANATTDSEAALGAGRNAIYDVYVRLLGGRGAGACGCADTRRDPLSGETLCRLGSVDLTSRGGASKLQLAPAWLFDPKRKDLTWTANALAGSRVVQICVYSPPSPIRL